MQMQGSQVVSAEKQQVWLALNDVEVLKQSIPGCTSIEKTSPSEMIATVTLKVGPIKANFKGSVVLSEIQPPDSYVITGKGNGGVAGQAEGGARIELATVPEGTLLTYVVNAQVSGKIAQLGGRLIDATASKLAKQFFERFIRIAEASATSANEVGSGDLNSEKVNG